MDETSILTTPNSKAAIDTYHTNKAPTRKKERTIHPTPKTQPLGWHPKNTTFSTTPINPDLDSAPTGTYEITQHPTNYEEILLHAPDGRIKNKLTQARLQRLTTLNNPTDNSIPLLEAIANLTHIHTKIDTIHTQTTETKLYKSHKLYPEETNNGIWPLPDTIYHALNTCFNIQREIRCNPIVLPLRAKTYISYDSKDAAFGALPYTKSAWSGVSLALPEYKVGKLKTALEQAIYSAHVCRHTSPSSHILFLLN